MSGRDRNFGLTLMFAPLYVGPVAAGWSAASPITLFIFFGVIYLIHLRTTQGKSHKVSDQIVSLVTLAIVHMSIIAAAFGIGMLLAMLTGPLTLPVWFPLALTGCSAAIGALRYRHAQDDAAMLDLIDTLENSAAPTQKSAQKNTTKKPTGESQ